MGVPQTMEALRERAIFMKDSLHRSQSITDSMVAIFGSFDHRLSALETALRPTQAIKRSLQGGEKNEQERSHAKKGLVDTLLKRVKAGNHRKECWE
ncbi:hypothetical protein K2173_005717 [Erythroxylum novogranatense]|uniref:Uncharacterized protein n=1 Tax=Erythroxylum novogranatense TaxID=1862640 RepID=A0AAV8SQJ9_9ROSI|nr:hypothetical protein K2173_005717 [Erythroxylum novogranatense]